jgi:tRNA-dihydrouridine synthase A
VETKPPPKLDRRLAVAPMLDWTDRHCRYFLRLLSRRTLLYTEMITTGAIVHGDRHRFLDFHPAEHPVALQLGGSDPAELATCARIGADWGYDEINLNVGCPSDRVQSGRFGACLMAEPGLVAECVAAMRAAVAVPVTVKHRIGIDRLDDYDTLAGFVATVAEAGCTVFVVHARKAWLDGLSPKQNRELPPLRYDVVHRLKTDFSALDFVINGGFKTLAQVEQQLARVDGVMVGREAYQHPRLLAQADARIFGDAQPAPTPRQVLDALLPYIEAETARGTRLHHITRHILGLFQGRPRARSWRRYLAEHAHDPAAGADVVEQAMRQLPDASLDQP